MKYLINSSHFLKDRYTLKSHNKVVIQKGWSEILPEKLLVMIILIPSQKEIINKGANCCNDTTHALIDDRWCTMLQGVKATNYFLNKSLMT